METTYVLQLASEFAKTMAAPTRPLSDTEQTAYDAAVKLLRQHFESNTRKE